MNEHKDVDLTLKKVLDLKINRDFDRVRDFDQEFDRDLGLSFERALTFGHELNIDFKLALTRDLARDLTKSQVTSYTLEIALDFALNFIDSIYDKCQVFYHILDRALEKMEIDSVPYQSLRTLINRLPAHNNSLYNRKQWWEKNGNGWIKGFRRYMIEYHNIGHDWQFSNTQVSLLQQYYDANKLLVDCLNSDCYVSQSVRQEIEDTLLLTIPSSCETTNIT